MADLVRVLCIDDEPLVLEGLALQLRRGYDFVSAESGEEGLVALVERGPFAVVMSDMRMPGMDGATFLARALELSPDTTRMLLTGYSDIQAAIAAVNQGQIFRFLTKPISPTELRGAFEAAVEQHRLVTAEKVLLEQTVRGAVKALTDVLALASPVAFGRTTRVRGYAAEISSKSGLKDAWALDVAAMLSQLGLVSVPDSVLEKLDAGAPLSGGEQAMIERAPQLTRDLVAEIPRLEAVGRILALSAGPLGKEDGAPDDETTVCAKILKIALDFEELTSRGSSAEAAIEAMGRMTARYDLELLRAFRTFEVPSTPRATVLDVGVRQLAVGMVFAEDAFAATGVLLIRRGSEVTASLLERVRNFQPGFVREPLRIIGRNG